MEGKEVSNIFDHPGAAFVLIPAGIKYPPSRIKAGKKQKTFNDVVSTIEIP